MPRPLRFALAWVIVLGALAAIALAVTAIMPDPAAGPTSTPTSTPTATPSASPTGAAGAPRPPADAFPATVRWVSDGDTIGADTADRREIQVRLIGIDAPETKKPGSPIECYGPEASAELVRLLPKGTVITAAYQKFRIDRYQRDLWDIWLPDGTFVQGHLVERGLARTQTFGGTNRDAPYLNALQERARQTNTGLWGACPMS